MSYLARILKLIVISMTFVLYIVHEYNRSSYGYIVMQAVSQYISTSETETVKPLAELTGVNNNLPLQQLPSITSVATYRRSTIQLFG